MTGTIPLVRAEEVARTYGSGPSAVVAVHGATFEINPGQQIALTGTSGSGKSTLLHLIAGLDHPTRGSLSWPAFEGSPLRPGPVAVVFQAPSLLAFLDVEENVALPLLLTGARPDQAQAAARQSLDILDLGHLGARLPEELSGGQAQRVAVARALTARPHLLLAAEPTGQLDRAAAEAVVGALVAAADASSCALLVSTHDPDVADRFLSRWRMEGGRLTLPAEPPTREVDRCSA